MAAEMDLHSKPAKPRQSPYWGPLTISGMQAIPFDACCGIVLTDLSHSWWKLGGKIYALSVHLLGVAPTQAAMIFHQYLRTGAQR